MGSIIPILPITPIIKNWQNFFLAISAKAVKIVLSIYNRDFPMHILFVCSGNTCRSPMAEAYFRHLAEKAKLRGVTVSSAGTFTSSGTGASQASIAVMKKYGIDI